MGSKQLDCASQTNFLYNISAHNTRDLIGQSSFQGYFLSDINYCKDDESNSQIKFHLEIRPQKQGLKENFRSNFALLGDQQISYYLTKAIVKKGNMHQFNS